MLHERHFKALGTDFGIWLWTLDAEADALLDAVPGALEDAEQELSRFRPDSELSRLNAAAGCGPQSVSPILWELCRLAVDFAHATEGIFDPTILSALRSAGYSASFTSSEALSALQATALQEPIPSLSRWREIKLAPHLVSLPEGAPLDLGGLAKGWVVDRLAEVLSLLGPVLVDGGGDIRAFGNVGGRGLPVGVADPFSEERELTVLELRDEAIATSSIGRRRWQKGEQWMHHLIDPRNQRPCESDLHSVTVIGPTALQCEVFTKVALILGSTAGARRLEAEGLSAVLVGRDGDVRCVGPRFFS